jgi:hypothetical protein
MALADQQLQVNLAQGVDTKSDPKQVIQGRLLDLRNGVFHSLGRIKKRNGFGSVLAQSVMSENGVADGSALMVAKDQLLLHDGTHLFSWSPTMSKWTKTSAHTVNSMSGGGVPAMTVATKALTRWSWAQGHPDMALHSLGYTVAAWENPTTTGVFWSVIDTATGNRLYADQALPNPASLTGLRSPKVMAIGNYVLVFFIGIDGASQAGLYYCAFDTSAPQSGLANPVLVRNNLSSTATERNYDVALLNGSLVVAHNTGTAIEVSRITPSLTLTAAISSIAEGAKNCITVFADGQTAGRVFVAWCDGTNVRRVVYQSNLTTVDIGPETVVAAAAVTITGASIAGTSHALYYTLTPQNQVPSWHYFIRASVATSAGAWAWSSFTLARSVGLAGKAFVYNGAYYIPALYDSYTQSTQFLLDQTGRPIARVLAGSASNQLVGANNTTGTTTLPEHNQSGAAVTFAMQETLSLGTNGIEAVSYSFGGYLSRSFMADTMHFAGGLLWMYDGAVPVEHGFHVFPEVVTVPNPGGAYVYQYVACYEWTDSQGHIHRSAPSIPATHAQASAIDASSNAVPVNIPTLRLTSKHVASGGRAARSPLKVVVYRTQNTGSIFYRCLDVTQAATVNDPTIDTVQFIDTTTDAQLASHQLLYTTGGVLDNFVTPAPAYLTTVRNRMWLINSTNPLQLYYSKETGAEAPVEFNDSLTYTLSAFGGDSVALADLDGVVIVLRKGGISRIVGYGPPPNGDPAQNDFEDLRVPTDIGCTDPASVVVSTPGVFYKSQKGFYLLDRSMRVTYVGADVEAYNAETVTSAQMLPYTNWIVFTLGNGKALLYDYYLEQWSIFDNIAAVDATVWQNAHVYLDTDGLVHQETPGTFNDNGSYVPLSATLAWVRLGSLAGFQRVWELIVVGEWKSAHKVTVELRYDYDEDTVVQTETFEAPVAQKPFEFRVQCERQECQAIQVKLIEEAYDSTKGEGLSISGVAFSIGVEPGLWRLPAAQTVG